MKLLLDENISPRAVAALEETYPGTRHVRDVDLSSALDEALWSYAAEHGFLIVSTDSDFYQLSFVRGFPPKVVWIRLGNCTTDQIIELLVARRSVVQESEADAEAAFLELPRRGVPGRITIRLALSQIAPRACGTSRQACSRGVGASCGLACFRAGPIGCGQ